MSSLILPPPPPPLVVPDLSGDVGGYIAKYIVIRDKLNALKAQQTKDRAPLQAALDMLENGFLKVLDGSKSDNMKATSAGTIYRTVKKRASIEDGDLFRRHVIGSEDWDVVDWRANANQVHASMTKNKQPVPGVKYSEDVEVGIRRA